MRRLEDLFPFLPICDPLLTLWVIWLQAAFWIRPRHAWTFIHDERCPRFTIRSTYDSHTRYVLETTLFFLSFLPPSNRPFNRS